ncbi:hypothetical protein [Neobacillus niacini]|uniref:hypothetical protein n=1 Tax=Neobacillus niacini TaxID=86668 RepID=UPI00285C3F3B|nr:hypothetical protein [Neobacillus niacini]MDR7001944.1 divalent metal cation (Fe/Co/Zn/Cd) transporter [Neobacillus niacini]
MSHLFYNHIFSGLLILILGIFIMLISIYYTYAEYKKQKNETLISLILDNLFGFLLGAGPTGITFGIYFSLIVIIFGGWVLIYGQNHI